MTWLLILLTIIMLVLIYLVFAPFYIEINSDEGLYGARFHRLASARLRLLNSSLFLDLKIAGWQKQMDLLAIKKMEKKKLVKTEKEKKKPISFQKMLSVAKSFHINKFFLTIDTGNMQANGILYPVAILLGMKYKKNMTINFLDENKLILEIENNIARMLWAFIKS